MSVRPVVRTLLPLAFCLAAGCASLNSVSLTRVPVDRSRPIEAESWSWGIFGIYFTNSFVDEAIENIQHKCPKGRITGVYTKYTGRFFFLWTTRTVNVKAYCEPVQAAAAPAAPPVAAPPPAPAAPSPPAAPTPTPQAKP